MNTPNADFPYGFVYILRAEESDFYKIGFSMNLTQRIRKLSIQLPFKIMTHTVVRIKRPDAAEGLLHKIWEANRVNGEWFKFNANEAAEVRWYITHLASEVIT